MLDVTTFIEVAGTASSLTVGYLIWRLQRPRQRPLEAPRSKWQVGKLPDGTWSVVTTDKIPALGINEQTVYGGYSQDDASEVARWLNDETDLRSLAQVLQDAEVAHKKAAEEREQRRLAGGTPVFELGSNIPVDYVIDHDHAGRRDICDTCAMPIVRHDSGWHHPTSAQKDAEEYSHWNRKRLEGLARQRHHMALRQMKVMSKADLVRLLAYDEPPPAPGTQDITCEYDLRQALNAWREWVKKNDPGEDWSIAQTEQLEFIHCRASELGLKHVLLSVMHADPEVFDPPWRAMPIRSELR